MGIQMGWILMHGWTDGWMGYGPGVLVFLVYPSLPHFMFPVCLFSLFEAGSFFFLCLRLYMRRTDGCNERELELETGTGNGLGSHDFVA
ncbi:hypothetical protein B0T22DRAFT_469053 [Podospora appendiculata]|uniref:Uncharacterized protein n=1 Tax=Podospora appendiculata TaxID=314037 RepID=A0AAE0X3A9_9PEZI|nr:hypothetical protein B0T22DRAFT_469053 [Podospora appendiculata]